MTLRKRQERLRGILVALFAASALIRSDALMAEVATIPVPRIVIYPGDIISDDMLTDAPISEVEGAIGTIVEDRSALLGRLARRTLLPGRAVLTIAVGNPRAIKNGSEVTLYYSEGDLKIITEASALQDASVGDVVKVRNADSGITVSGIVQPDGSVRVSGG